MAKLRRMRVHAVGAGPLNTHCSKKELADGTACAGAHECAHHSSEPLLAIKDCIRCMYIQLRVTNAVCKTEELKLGNLRRQPLYVV